jgi:signal transduction histidine kinase
VIKEVQVLHVENDAGDADIVRRLLAGLLRPRFNITWNETIAAAVQSLQSGHFDVLLLDRGLPGTTDLEGLVKLQEVNRRIPIVILTDYNVEQAALSALDHGVQDYLIKEQLTTDNLTRAIRYAVQRQSLVLKLSAARHLLVRKNRRLAKLYRTAHDFVENVSHEFRTPLTVITEYVSLIKDGVVGEVSPDQQRLLTIVEDRADDLNTMVDDMLDISKLEAGLLGIYRKDCQVSEILDHVWPSLVRKAAVKGVQIDCEVEPELPLVFCDSEKAGRVLINLTTNAIKFCGQPGQVRLVCHKDQDSLDVTFSVSDNGSGISAENQQLIFRRFQQLGAPVRGSTKGFGLGLGIAKELVDLNLGTIRLESEPGRGSTFSFTLPLANPEEVMRRNLLRIENLRNGHSNISLVTAELALETPNSLADEFDEIMSYLLRGNDLIFRAAKARWLIALPIPESELPQFRKRIDTALDEANRNRMGGPLPAVRFHRVGTWPVASGREEIFAHIRHFLNSEEATDDRTLHHSAR